LRKYINIFTTMVICGVWHGAAWTYVLFGAVHGVALTMTRFFQELRGKKDDGPLLTGLSVFLNFTFVSLSFCMFRATSMENCLAMYRRLTTFTTYIPNLHPKVMGIIFLALLLQWTPRKIYAFMRDSFVRAPAPAQAFALFAVAVSLREAVSEVAVPFVYFQF
jgi:D-alanyl-lipoteichoic acid acyltransferase DltB (MBOAT superfamily)